VILTPPRKCNSFFKYCDLTFIDHDERLDMFETARWPSLVYAYCKHKTIISNRIASLAEMFASGFPARTKEES